MKFTWENPHLSTESLDSRSKSFEKVGDHFPFSLNAYSLGNHEALLSELFEIFSFKSVTEIGVFRGELSKVLMSFMREGGRINLLDIKFEPEARAQIEKSAVAEKVDANFMELRSAEALKLLEHSDLIVIDGDHNYETVSQELLECKRIAPKVIVLDDVGWPCDVWDISYDPAELQEKDAYSEGVELSPLSPELLDSYGLKFDWVKQRRDRSGSKPAVEEFLSENPTYRYFSVPAFFGVGVLWDLRQVSAVEAFKLRELAACYDSDVVTSLIQTMELNRLMMLIHMQNAGKIWRGKN